MKPLLSVVIPTKNRYETLIPVLEVIEEYASNLLEIVVQDNSDDNVLLRNYIDKKNVKYNYLKEWLSVSANCDQAILQSSGEYVLFIGDDDAFSPEVIDVVKLMKKYDIDSCFCNYSVYKWYTPNSKGIYPYEYKDCRYVLKIPDLEKVMIKTIENGIQNKDDFPCVYHGIIKREILDKIYNKTGSYFPGPSPDMSNAFALALVGCRHINVAIPFVIDGYSKVSTGHLTEVKKHVGRLEDQSFLPKNIIDNWTEQLPKVWLPNTIWPQSAIEAMKNMDRTDLINKINYSAIYIKISILYPQFKDDCYELSKKYSTKGRMIKTFISIGIHYVLRCLTRKRKSYIIKAPITIGDAIKENSKLIQEKNMLDELKRKLMQYRLEDKI